MIMVPQQLPLEGICWPGDPALRATAGLWHGRDRAWCKGVFALSGEMPRDMEEASKSFSHSAAFALNVLDFAGFGRDFVCVLEQDWLGKPVQYHCHNPCPLSIQQLGTWTDCSMDERRIASKDFRCTWFATMNTFYRGRIWNETCWSYKHSLATLLCP